MKFDLYATVSMNGYIASADGTEDCFPEQNWEEFKKIVSDHGNLIWGRKTYKKVLSWGEEYIFDFKDEMIFVLSGEETKSEFKNVVFCKDINDLNTKLEENGMKVGLVSGGTSLYSDFLEKNMISRMIINYNSVIVDNGTPLFKDISENSSFEIVSTEILDSNILQVEFKQK